MKDSILQYEWEEGADEDNHDFLKKIALTIIVSWCSPAISYLKHKNLTQWSYSELKNICQKQAPEFQKTAIIWEMC